MSSFKEIGGYFELELPRPDGSEVISETALKLNSARNCIEYILEASRPTKVYIPKFTCDVVLEPFEKTGVEYEFYDIDIELEIAQNIELKDNEMLLYTNYFGVKSDYTAKLAREHGIKLIVDASQAFYYKPVAEEKVVYSPRKFFGVPDGGILVTDKKIERSLQRDVSYDRMSHLLKRLELPAGDAYDDFKRNDASLENQPVLAMSKITDKLLAAVDYDAIRKARRGNFKQLHKTLGASNELNLILDNEDVPMVYPYLTKQAPQLRSSLIQHKVFVATYWPNVFTWSKEGDAEFRMARDILALPIDQRYDEEDMKRILEIVHEG